MPHFNSFTGAQPLQKYVSNNRSPLVTPIRPLSQRLSADADTQLPQLAFYVSGSSAKVEHLSKERLMS